MSTKIDIGAPAPEFNLPRDGGDSLALSDLRGKTVALFFYPKDDTSGCTREAIGFSEALADFDAAGAVAIGCSRDPVEAHDTFRDKHGLKIPLVSDETGATCEAYGVWVEKSMYGRKYMGIERATFLIDAEGVIRAIWRKVKVPGHVQAVLAAASEL